jgi:hypothetical protein
MEEKIVRKGGVKWKMLKGGEPWGALPKIACLRCPVKVVSPQGGGGRAEVASADGLYLFSLFRFDSVYYCGFKYTYIRFY